MNVLVTYFTMGGRTKKVAEIIGNALTGCDVTYAPFELTGHYIDKIKTLDNYEHGNFAMIENDLRALDASDYDLILVGMPTYGGKPPKIFDEILKRMQNLDGKKVAVFCTARFTGGKNLQYMKVEIGKKGAEVPYYHNFRGLIRIGKKSLVKFAKEIIS